jgi:5'-3' exonuclease
VQLDRRKGVLTDENGVRERYGIPPQSIPDWLALVGDSADGFPGLSGWGRSSASQVLARYGHIEAIPDDVADWDRELIRTVRSAPRLASRLASERERAMLFKVLATLRVDRSLLAQVDELAWRGPTPSFEDTCRYLREESLAARMAALGGA